MSDRMTVNSAALKAIEAWERGDRVGLHRAMETLRETVARDREANADKVARHRMAKLTPEQREARVARAAAALERAERARSEMTR